ncbi:MAG: hypothetical protein J6112_09275, partial [Clostridia bacterium]|nr:hypothetical protein [Clostridia bacterium]
ASMVPLLLSSLLGTVTVLIIKRLKYKNVFQVIIYFLYFALIFALMFNSYGMRNIANSPILKLLPHFSFFRDAVFGRDILQLLIFVVINLGAFALVVLFISCLYKPINSMKQYAGSGKFNERGRTAASQISVLLKKDLKMIVNKPALLVNSVMGPIMFAITAAMMLIMPIEGKNNGDVPPDITLLAVGVMFGLMMCSATNAASSSLSFEGKNFELLLSYPVKHTVVLRSKLISSFVIPSAIALISSSVILGLSFAKGFVTGNSIPLIISIFIGPQLSLIYATVMSLICNLRWPKLDFESDIQVTKNSKSVLFATLFCTLPALPIGVIVLILSLILPPAGLIAMLFIYAGLITFRRSC